MKESARKAQSIVGTSPGRDKTKDFYPTPDYATDALLRVENFADSGNGNIWECACGNGALSKRLNAFGYTTYDSDLYDYGYGHSGIDFLKTDHLMQSNIVTNPPFNIAVPFLIHALDLKAEKIAFLCKLTFLEGQDRTAILKTTPLKNVWVFQARLTMTRNGEPLRSGGMIAFAWYVWERGYTGRPMIGWI